MSRMEKTGIAPPGAIHLFNNQGFVALVDSMGDDTTVVNAARVSFGKRVKRFDETKDAKLVNFLAEHKHLSPFRHCQVQFHLKCPEFIMRQCYDAETEVLTDKGWIFWPDVIKEDKLAAVHPDGTWSLEKPSDYIYKNYQGKMIHFKSQSVDLRVTPDHRMWVRTRINKKWSKPHFLTAEECLHGEHKLIPVKKMKDSNGYFSTNDITVENDCFEDVYCATVSTGILLVRRNEKIASCGNCYKHIVGVEWTPQVSPTNDHSWSEISGRYQEYDEFYTPETFRPQSKNNKQCSEDGNLNKTLTDFNLYEDDSDSNLSVEEMYAGALTVIKRAYKALLDAGVSKEQARLICPFSTMTEVYWTASLQAIANFIKLRNHPGAQWEIREMAIAVEALTEQKFPYSIKALMKHL